MRARKHVDPRQLGLVFGAVEHSAKSANDPRFSNSYSIPARPRGTFDLTDLADQIQAEDRLRLLEPTSLPKRLRGWSPRPTPQTAIIAYAAQRAYERRVQGCGKPFTGVYQGNGCLMSSEDAAAAMAEIEAMTGMEALDPGLCIPRDMTPTMIHETLDRHTVDTDRRPVPEKQSFKGAMWAWIGMTALVALYYVWRWWK